MKAKLPLHLQNKMPFAIGDWLIWTDTIEHTELVYDEIELRKKTRPQHHLSCGVFRFMDIKTMKPLTCHYVRQSDYANADVCITVAATDPGDNQEAGISITNAIEVVVIQVCEEFSITLEKLR